MCSIVLVHRNFVNVSRIILCIFCSRYRLLEDLSMLVHVLFFFFKQKTAYEVRIRDWSSDVCSSDLLGWTLPDSIGAPSESPAGTWTFVTAGASLADVQSLVDSFQVTPPAGFDGEIAVTVTTTTAEAATEAGPNGGSGEECDNTDNVDVDSYNFTVTVNPTTQPPETELGVAVGHCLTEDTAGALAFSATPEGDDQITQIVSGGFPVAVVAWSVDAGSVSLPGLDPTDFTASYDPLTGELTIDIVNPMAGPVTGTVTVTPNLNSDVDAALTIKATATDGSSASGRLPEAAATTGEAGVGGRGVT